MRQLYVIFLLLAFCACDANKEVLFVRLTENTINADHSGVSKDLLVVSNCTWAISEMPEWCEVSKHSADEGQYLRVTVLPNTKFDDRQATILISGEGVSTTLTVSQSGIKNSTSLEWHTFPVNTLSDVKYEQEGDGETSVRISGERMFIGTSLRDHIWHGSLLNTNFVDILNPASPRKYTYAPISIVGMLGGKAYFSEGQIASYENSDALAQRIIDAVPTQSSTFFVSDAPIQYNSYRHLHLLGVGNMGLRLDEIISGQSYRDGELGARTGMIYSYCAVDFETVMDYPGTLVTEDITEAERKYLSYVNSIQYGRTALLVVETEYDLASSKTTVKKIMQGDILTTGEDDVKKSIAAWYIYFDRNGIVHAKPGSVDVIKEYTANKHSEAIIPLNFSVNKYSDNSAGKCQFTFNLP